MIAKSQAVVMVTNTVVVMVLTSFLIIPEGSVKLIWMSEEAYLERMYSTNLSKVCVSLLTSVHFVYHVAFPKS